MRKTVTKTRGGIVAALDIGTSKTCCIVARVDGAAPKAIGVGQHGSRGVKAGAVVDMEAAQQSILQAVHAAEQMAGETIQGVMVNLSGGHPSSRTSLHEISVEGHEISDADLRKALTDGRLAIDEPADRTVLHTIPVGFTIDGSRGIRDPRGMFGHRLGAHMHAVSVSTGALKTLASCVSRCHLDIHGVVVSPYAAGLAALVEDERQLGVTLIDMGAGTTTLAVFFDGNLVFTDCVPIGGMHVTNDIARGLSTPLAHAERMKTLYGTALISSADEKEIIDVPLIGEDNDVHANHVPKSILTGIIQPRLEETFELVRSRLEASGFDKLAAPRVVLVGGGAQLQGVRDLAALLLDKTVRLGRPGGLQALADPFTGPAFTACAGLIHYTLQPAVEAVRRSRPRSPHPGGIFARLGLWLKENF